MTKRKKRSPESIAKMLATRAARKAERARLGGAAPLLKQQKREYTRKRVPFEPRTHEQLERDMKEALWCIDRAVAKTRRKIRAGELSLTDVTDEETFLYMAKRYLEGGLKP